MTKFTTPPSKFNPFGSRFENFESSIEEDDYYEYAWRALNAWVEINQDKCTPECLLEAQRWLAVLWSVVQVNNPNGLEG